MWFFISFFAPSRFRVQDRETAWDVRDLINYLKSLDPIATRTLLFFGSYIHLPDSTSIYLQSRELPITRIHPVRSWIFRFRWRFIDVHQRFVSPLIGRASSRKLSRIVKSTMTGTDREKDQPKLEFAESTWTR